MIRKKQTIRLFANDITGDLVKDRQEVVINWRAGQLVLDEPSFNGGKDIGPDPFTTVLSGLVLRPSADENRRAPCAGCLLFLPWVEV